MSSRNCRRERGTRQALELFTSLEARRMLSADPVTLGPELVFPGDTNPELSVGQQTSPSLAEGPNGVSLAVWQDTRSGGHPADYFGTGLGTMTDIYAARVRADGSVIDVTPIPISAASYNQIQPKASWNGTNWLVAWNTERSDDMYETDINAVRVSPEGALLDAQPIVIGTHVPQQQASNDLDPIGPLNVVSDGQDWVVTYRRYDPTIDGGIGMRWFATKVLASGAVPNQEGVNYFTADQYSDDIGWAYSPVNGGQYLNVSNSNGQIVIKRYDENLAFVNGSQRVMDGGGLSRFDVAGGPTGWIMSWNYEVAWSKPQVVRVNASGNFIDSTPLDVTDWLYGVDTFTDVAWNGTDWSVAFTGYDSADETVGAGLLTRRIDPVATGVDAYNSANFNLTPNATGGILSPTLVGSGDGGFKAVYTDQSSNAVGVAITVVSPTNAILNRADVSLAAPSQTSADLASDGQNFLMVFNSSTAYGTRLLAQRVTPQGTAIDAEPMEIASTAERPIAYEVVYMDGRYVVIYQATNGAEGNQIYARPVDVDGTIGAVTTLMTVQPFVGFNLNDTSVSGDRLIVIGNSNEGQNHRSSRFFRIFDSNLQSISERTSLDYGFATSGDTEPVNGGWITAWSSKSSHDVPRASLLYAVVDLDGNFIKTTATIASAWPYHHNGVPTVTSNGGEAGAEAMIMFTQTLDPVNPTGTAEGIRAQRVALDGTLLGEVFTLIDEPGMQTQPSAVFDGTNYVMSWTDQRNYAYPQQPRDDIFAARVAVDGTVLDPGGFAVADSFRPEMHGDVAVAGGQVMFVYRTFRHEAPWGSYRLAARAMSAAESIALSVAPQGFAFERDQAFEFVFNKPLIGADTNDLLVENLTTGQTISSDDFSVQVVPASTTGWTYRWIYTGANVPDGVYCATLPAGSVTDYAGVANASDSVINTHVLAGDVDRDQTVNFNDLLIVAQNYGQSGRSFSRGNVDYSEEGLVDFNDLLIIAQRYGISLPSMRGSSPFASSRMIEEVLI